MPKIGIKFVSDFLIPHLNSGKFGERLKWIDIEKKIFEIEWCHKSVPSWTEQVAEVFVEWDKHKGHFHPDDKEYFTKSKQRFRAMLYKLTHDGVLINMDKDIKYKQKKRYRIAQRDSKRKQNSKLNAEHELSNEDESIDDAIDYDIPVDIYRRKISEDDVRNVLEDHAYINSNSSRDNCTEIDETAKGNFIAPVYGLTRHLDENVEQSKICDEYFMMASSMNGMQQLPLNFLKSEEIMMEIENLNTSKPSDKLQDCHKMPEGSPVLTDITICNQHFNNQNQGFNDI